MYLAGSSFASIGLAYLFPQVSEGVTQIDLDKLCTSSPKDPRCKNYAPGVVAIDASGKAIQVDTLLKKAKPGIPFPVKGLPNSEINYLVIKKGPQIAEYAIRPICPHAGCTVNWDASENHFICPCHESEFDAQGKLVKGPAKSSLQLITVAVKQNQIRLINRKPVKDPR
jgi:cytochrome b6-f complex iron-sulfur subunit